MAKFAGFSQEQDQVLKRKVAEGLGLPPNAQQDEVDLFIASSPGASSKMGRYTDLARQMVEGKPLNMANGGFVFPTKNARGNVNKLNQQDNPEYAENIEQQMATVAKLQNTFPTPQEDTRRFQEGGTTTDPAKTFLDTAQQDYSTSLAEQQTARDALAADPSNAELVTALTAADSKVAQRNEAVNQASAQFKQTSLASPAEMVQQATTDPMSLVTKATTKTTEADQTTSGLMDTTAGQMGATTTATPSAADAAAATTPTVTPANLATAATSAPGVKTATDATQAAQGTVSSTMTAAEKSPSEVAQLGLTAAQIAESAKIADTADRTLETGETISGSTVDMDRVKAETNFEAATGAPSTDATVQGQLTGLMRDFEGGNQPAWAAGAMRAASAAMAQRGLGASSMAGQAIIQAAMESALPIAQMDAATFSRFEEQNLSNKQQAAMFSAEKRAEFLGLEFNQGFQARVSNAAKVSEIANINFTADQQIALENARMAQTVDLTNLSATNAKIMSDAAALSQIDLTNLNNRQQAQSQNAKSFLEMDMANLNNAQQTELFKSQAVVNSLLSDQAAANATSQFNASSENQTDQFFGNLTTQVSQFNTDQSNAISKFNAGEANALSEFNTAQINLREQFNAQNGLIIEQANAEWYQKIATTDNAAINQSNREAAAQANNMTSLGFGAYMQEVRDLMSFAWQTANNDAERATTLTIAKLEREAAEYDSRAKKSAGLWGAVGSIGAALFRRT